MRIFWTIHAESDLDHIHTYIAQDNPAAAMDVVFSIIETAETLLAQYSHIGKAGRVNGTREFVVSDYPNYVLIYRIKAENLEILRVLHAAQKWP